MTDTPTTEAPRGYSPEGEPWHDDGDAPGPRWALWDYEGRKWDKLPPGYDPEAWAGLDVERLMVAVFNADNPGDYPRWDEYIAAFGSPGTPPWRRKAEKIAAEYAALARQADQ